MAFGDGSASAWLVTSLADLNKFSGSKNMDDGQTKWLAKLLFQEYKNVKYSVMQLFFYRFKVGDFGKFWGKVDPMVITCALKDFMVECENMRQQFLNEEYDRRKAEEDTIRKVLREKWDSCFSDLWKSSPDDDSKRVFQSIGFINYDKESNLLLLKVRREEFELIEGKYLSIFSAVIKKHYPRVKVQYFLPRESVITLEAPSNKKNDYPAHQQREVQQGIISAHAIIANKFVPLNLAFLVTIAIIILPITSGDTALRGLRITIAEALNLEQKSIFNRLFWNTKSSTNTSIKSNK